MLLEPLILGCKDDTYDFSCTFVGIHAEIILPLDFILENTEGLRVRSIDLYGFATSSYYRTQEFIYHSDSTNYQKHIRLKQLLQGWEWMALNHMPNDPFFVRFMIYANSASVQKDLYIQCISVHPELPSDIFYSALSLMSLSKLYSTPISFIPLPSIAT